VRDLHPPRRGPHRSGDRQRLEKRHLPLRHELGLRRMLVLGEEIGVEDDGVVAEIGHAVHLAKEEGNRVSYTAVGV